MYLATRAVNKRFGGIVALDDVSVDFHPGSITALIGSNGAGKTTLFNVIGGLVAPDSGDVVLGKDVEIRLSGLTAHQVARLGVGMLFQDVRVFGKLSAIDNVMVGARGQLGESLLKVLLSPGKIRREEQALRERAMQHLAFVGLDEKAHLWAENLSFGQQKLLGLARLLAADARVLLLDEPTSGVHPQRIGELLGYIRKLADDHDRTVVMIEHNPEAVVAVSDNVFQMEEGRIVAHGAPAEIPALRPHQPNPQSGDLALALATGTA